MNLETKKSNILFLFFMLSDKTNKLKVLLTSYLSMKNSSGIFLDPRK
jgi:hypothetical protein